MTAHASDYRDTVTRADLERALDAALGALTELGVMSDASPAGPTGRFTRAEDRRAAERKWFSHWHSAVTSDDDQAERWRDITERHTRGGER